jgi:acetyl-CoA carboxylase biotin carboxylase subunit
MVHTDFCIGNYNTHFIENNLKSLTSEFDCGEDCEDLALIVTYVEYMKKLEKAKQTVSLATLRHGADWKAYARRKGVKRL